MSARGVLFFVSLFCAPIASQPWPWPTFHQNTVYPIDNNFGEYQEFLQDDGVDIYCHPGVDIMMSAGDSIYSVLPAGKVNIDRSDSSKESCTDKEYFEAIWYNYPPEDREGWDGGEIGRLYFGISTYTMDHNILIGMGTL